MHKQIDRSVSIAVKVSLTCGEINKMEMIDRWTVGVGVMYTHLAHPTCNADDYGNLPKNG